jgi:hypothetical protein
MRPRTGGCLLIWRRCLKKAGCQPAYLGEIVLKELVDNALGAGANVSLDHDGDAWIVCDDGPGLDPADVPRLFCVNRALLSSKLKRLPLRGMLGNGLRAVVGAIIATEGTLVAETRGRRMTLATCRQTGHTNIVSDELIPQSAGMTVRVSIGSRDPTDDYLARGTIAVASYGEAYSGPSSSWWYGPKDLHKLFTQVTPADTTVGAVCRSLGLDRDDGRPAPTLGRDEAEAVRPSSCDFGVPSSRYLLRSWASSEGAVGPPFPATGENQASPSRKPALTSHTLWRLGPFASARSKKVKEPSRSPCSSTAR